MVLPNSSHASKKAHISLDLSDDGDEDDNSRPLKKPALRLPPSNRTPQKLAANIRAVEILEITIKKVHHV